MKTIIAGAVAAGLMLALTSRDQCRSHAPPPQLRSYIPRPTYERHAAAAENLRGYERSGLLRTSTPMPFRLVAGCGGNSNRARGTNEGYAPLPPFSQLPDDPDTLDCSYSSRPIPSCGDCLCSAPAKVSVPHGQPHLVAVCHGLAMQQTDVVSAENWSSQAGRSLKAIAPSECAGYFRNAGYRT